MPRLTTPRTPQQLLLPSLAANSRVCGDDGIDADKKDEDDDEDEDGDNDDWLDTNSTLLGTGSELLGSGSTHVKTC